MKIRIFFTVLVIGIISFSSLKAQISIGPGVAYGTNIDQIGVLGNVTYNFAQKWGVMGDLTFFLQTQDITWTALDIDATYDFCKLNEKNNLYALAGLDFLRTKASILGYTATGNDTGLNLGVGWKMKLSNKIFFIPEARYSFISDGFLRIGARLMFSL